MSDCLIGSSLAKIVLLILGWIDPKTRFVSQIQSRSRFRSAQLDELEVEPYVVTPLNFSAIQIQLLAVEEFRLNMYVRTYVHTMEHEPSSVKSD